MKIIKTASYDLSKYQFTPAEEAQYIHLDTLFQQAAKQRDDLNHQLYKAHGASDFEQRQLEAGVENAQRTITLIGDKIYRLCEKARQRLSNTQPAKPKSEPTKGKGWLSKAVRRFGYTNDPRESGFLHPNGKMLDFSGKNKGRSQPGQRALDHRDVTSLDQELSTIANQPATGSWANSMRKFMMHSGAIRMHYSHGAMWIDMAAVPTKKQIQQMLNLCRDLQEVLVQARIVDGEKWEKYIQADPPNPNVSTQKVIQAVQEASRFLGKGNGQ